MENQVKTETAVLNVPEALVVKIDGIELAMAPRKMHETVLIRALEYGLRRAVNDKYSGEKGATKVELVRKLIADWEAGAELEGRSRGMAKTKVTETRKLARELATSYLTASLSKKLGNDMSAWAKVEKLAKLFRFTDKGAARFDLDAVDAWMEEFAAKDGGKDFMAEAVAMLDTPKDIDLDDLGL